MDTLAKIVQETLSEADSRLLQMSFSASPDQVALDLFLEGWDMEKAPLTEVVMLSYLMKMHPELSFPPDMLPRLTGVLSFCRFKYLDLVRHFGNYSRRLQARGVEFLVLKGGAMKALRPDFPRWLGDIDILVHEKDYLTCGRVAAECGFEILRSKQSMDLKIKGDGIMDVHRYIPMSTGRERAINNNLFARSTPSRVFSVEALMPSREDLLFGILVNLFRNIADASSRDSVLYSFFDTQYLLSAPAEEPFRWEIVRQNAALTGSGAHLAIAARFLNSVVPGLVPEDQLQDPGPREIHKWLVMIDFRRSVLHREREGLGDFNVLRTLRSGKPFIPYVLGRLRYLYHKGVQRCPCICQRILSEK